MKTVSVAEDSMRTMLDELHDLRAQRSELQSKCTAQALELRALRLGHSALAAQVDGFMRAFDQPQRDTPGVPDPAIVRLRAKLIIEEAFEYLDATFADDDGELARLCDAVMLVCDRARIDVDMEGVADACADLDYVVEGARRAYGIDGEPIAVAVHEANMAKVGGPVDPVTGKKLKPAGWQPPDIVSLLRAQGWKG